MGTIQHRFERHEKKYLLNEEQYRKLMEAASGWLKTDQHGEDTISSLYFDTHDFCLIRRSLEKPVYKEKLRLRSYGIPRDQDRVFVELKKKYQGVVYKRRVHISLLEAEQYLLLDGKLPGSSQVEREINWFFRTYAGLAPAMNISCQRLALGGTLDPELRVTFDRNILWRRESLSLKEGIWGQALLSEGQRLMEIKVPGAIPLWLVQQLDTLRIYPISYSKYGKAYQNYLTAGPKKEGVKISA